jgi:hypothetical protein
MVRGANITKKNDEFVKLFAVSRNVEMLFR